MDMPVKMKEYTFRGSNSSDSYFLPFSMGKTLKGKKCLLDFILEGLLSCIEAKQKSQKLLPFEKKVRKHGGIPIHLKSVSDVKQEWVVS